MLVLQARGPEFRSPALRSTSGMAACAVCNLGYGAETGESQEFTGQSSQPSKIECFRLSEGPCLKKIMPRATEEDSQASAWAGLGTCIYKHTHKMI